MSICENKASGRRRSEKRKRRCEWAERGEGRQNANKTNEKQVNWTFNEDVRHSSSFPFRLRIVNEKRLIILMVYTFKSIRIIRAFTFFPSFFCCLIYVHTFLSSLPLSGLFPVRRPHIWTKLNERDESREKRTKNVQREKCAHTEVTTRNVMRRARKKSEAWAFVLFSLCIEGFRRCNNVKWEKNSMNERKRLTKSGTNEMGVGVKMPMLAKHSLSQRRECSIDRNECSFVCRVMLMCPLAPRSRSSYTYARTVSMKRIREDALCASNEHSHRALL